MEKHESLTGHDCDNCGGQGGCSIEQTARYFKAHPDELDEFTRKLDSKEAHATQVSAMAESLQSKDTAGMLWTMAFGLGYICGKGEEVKGVKLSVRSILNAMKAMSEARHGQGMPEQN